MFQRRHYEWLANFGAKNLSIYDCHKLASNFEVDFENFDFERFVDRVKELKQQIS